MLEGGALAISIPLPEWKSIRPISSVLSLQDIAGQAFSLPLLRALDLVVSACGHAGFEPVFVARPEIFTHGENLAWLMAKLGSVRDHLSFSDGATIKLIPGLRNHVFFYGLSRKSDAEAVARLNRRFPEIFVAVHSQVNSALLLGSAEEVPEPVAIEGVTRATPEPAFYTIALHTFSPAESLRRTWMGGPIDQLPRGFDELIYVPLTETCLKDADFMRSVARLYDSTYFASARALVLRVPERVGDLSALEDRFEASLAALVEGGSRAPLAPARNAWMASDDVSPAALAAAASAADFLAHHTFDFWRIAPPDYRPFRSRKIVARRGHNLSEEFDDLVEALCGPGAQVIWRNDAGETSL
jgi:hypothetical protein